METFWEILQLQLHWRVATNIYVEQTSIFSVVSFLSHTSFVEVVAPTATVTRIAQ